MAVWPQAKVRDHGLWLRHRLYAYDDSATKAAYAAILVLHN